MLFINKLINFGEINKLEKMKRLLKYVMKVFYANENYAKFGVPGMNYFMALIGTTFYVMLTGFMVLFILMAIFPAFYRYDLSISSKIPSFLSGTLTLGFIFLSLRLAIKEDSLKDASITKNYVKKAVSYLLAYAILTILVVGFIGLKFLRHYKANL